jgi:hypothetical protein
LELSGIWQEQKRSRITLNNFVIFFALVKSLYLFFLRHTKK